MTAMEPENRPAETIDVPVSGQDIKLPDTPLGKSPLQLKPAEWTDCECPPEENDAHESP